MVQGGVVFPLAEAAIGAVRPATSRVASLSTRLVRLPASVQAEAEVHRCRCMPVTACSDARQGDVGGWCGSAPWLARQRSQCSDLLPAGPRRTELRGRRSTARWRGRSGALLSQRPGVDLCVAHVVVRAAFHGHPGPVGACGSWRFSPPTQLVLAKVHAACEPEVGPSGFQVPSVLPPFRAVVGLAQHEVVQCVLQLRRR